MSDMTQENRRLLERWVAVAQRNFYTPEDHPELMCYGTGESYHWAVQANGTAFAALAVLSMSPDLDEVAIGMKRVDLQQAVLKMLRYILRTHKCADALCSNGLQWGKSWISGLTMERMRHGIDAIWDLLTEEDRLALRKVLIAESDYLLDEFTIQAGYGLYENQPESNIWNGSMLLRTAMDYPDAPRRQEYLDKATIFFVNAISIPSDAESQQVYHGRKVKDLFVGANFTPSFSLKHNDYQNMGYAALALSNVGFLHFSAKKHGWTLPPEVCSHVRDLWEVLKHFFFQDGRMIRIGGDDRIRYCYCQDYAVPAWLFIWDYLKDPLALQFEANWRKIVSFEAMQNPDGAFLSSRLKQMALRSPFYYTRLEGDRAVSTSYGLYWRDAGLLRPDEKLDFVSIPDCFSWQDELHGATLDKNARRICSMTWDAMARPVTLCLPANRSDMGEWQNNLSGELITSNLSEAAMYKDGHRMFPGGFVNSGAVLWTEKSPYGEGEQEAVYARHAVAFAALPDGASAVCLQYAVTTRRIYLRQVKGMGVKMPNDLFNGKMRHYACASGRLDLRGYPGKEEIITLDSNWLNVDDCLSFIRADGEKGMVIYRPAEQQIHVTASPHTSLYADELCTEFKQLNQLIPGAKTVLDTGAVIVTGVGTEETARIATTVSSLNLGEGLRGVKVTGVDGKTYVFIANMTDVDRTVPSALKDCVPLHADKPQRMLAPFESVLYQENTMLI